MEHQWTSPQFEPHTKYLQSRFGKLLGIEIKQEFLDIPQVKTYLFVNIQDCFRMQSAPVQTPEIQSLNSSTNIGPLFNTYIPSFKVNISYQQELEQSIDLASINTIKQEISETSMNIFLMLEERNAKPSKLNQYQNATNDERVTEASELLDYTIPEEEVLWPILNGELDENDQLNQGEDSFEETVPEAIQPILNYGLLDDEESLEQKDFCLISSVQQNIITIDDVLDNTDLIAFDGLELSDKVSSNVSGALADVKSEIDAHLISNYCAPIKSIFRCSTAVLRAA